ncbi:MAG TPA: hypothetical protein VJ327_06460 [Patescibacteria group bacterium]|nr:hypothetical protein [Patescibacteria group bacterium]
MTKLVPHNYYQTAAIVPGHVLHPQNQIWIQSHDFSLDRSTRILYLGTAGQLRISGTTDSTHPLFEILWDRRRDTWGKLMSLISRFRPHHDISPHTLIFEIIRPDQNLPISPGDLIAITPDYLPDLAPVALTPHTTPPSPPSSS